jgi:D-alanyl-D-alanine carboxypeptidase
MRRRVLALALLVVSAVLFGVAAAHAKPLSAADRAYIDEVVAKQMQEGRLPGFSISITGPQGDYTNVYGVSNTATNAPFKLTDHVRIASITKTFVATAALRQIEQGNLAFSDKLSQFIKGVPNGNRITIKQMIAMRSGLYDYTLDPRWSRELEENPRMKFDWQGVVEILRRHKPEFEPGAKTVYADSNYYLLGAILEKVSGISIAKLVTQEVIEPLGLKHTVYPTSAPLPSPFSQGYYAGPEGKSAITDVTLVNPDIAGAAGAMASTLGDLRRYAKQLGQGALLSAAMQSQRLQFGLLSKSPQVSLGYGLGIMRVGRWLGHNGAVFGFSTVAMYEPRSGTTVVAAANLSSNFSTPTLEVFLQIAERLYPGSLKR